MMDYTKFHAGRVRIPGPSGMGKGTILPVKIVAGNSTTLVRWDLDENKKGSMEIQWSLELEHVVPEVSIVCTAILRRVGVKVDYRHGICFMPETIVIPKSLSMATAVSKSVTSIVLREEPPLGIYHAHFDAVYERAGERRDFQIVHKLQFVRPSLTRN